MRITPAAQTSTATAAQGRRGRFGTQLAVILGLALLVRVAYALAFAPPLTFFDDDTFFSGTSQLLAEGHGYIRPLDFFFRGHVISTAEHPPLYPLMLSLPRRVGINDVDALRMMGVILGTGTVMVAALIARRLAGERAGLVAAAVCAIYPAFIAADGAIMSETLFGLLVGLSVLHALRLNESPSVARAALLGALVGLSALTRSEGLLLVPLLGVPALIRAPRHRLRLGGVVVLAAFVVLTPWVARNWHVFGRPVLSTNQGQTIAGSNCHASYYGKNAGWFSISCTALPNSVGTNEAIRSSRLSSRGLRYAEHRPGRATVVAGIRLARVWGLYQPRRQDVLTGRRIRVQHLGVDMYYLIVITALVGLWILPRPRREKLILLAPTVLASLVALGSWGSARFRHEAEVIFIALAGVAVALLTTRTGGRTTLAPPARPQTPPVAVKTVAPTGSQREPGVGPRRSPRDDVP